MDINKEALGKTIKEVRLNLGLNMREFGELVDNTSDSIVSRWEKGKSVPNPERLRAIAKLANMSTTQFIRQAFYNFTKKYVYDFFLYKPREDVEYILFRDENRINSAINSAFDLLYDNQNYINNSKDDEQLKLRIDEICELAFNSFISEQQHNNQGAFNYVYQTISEVKSNLPVFFYRRYSESLWKEDVKAELRPDADLDLLNDLSEILKEAERKTNLIQKYYKK